MHFRNSSLLKWLLVILFMFYYVDGVFYTHVHVEGSRIINHSHPYSNAHHQHSSADFSLIRALSCVVTIAFAMVFSSVFRHVTRIILDGYDSLNNTTFYNLHAPLRGPPSC